MNTNPRPGAAEHTQRNGHVSRTSVVWATRQSPAAAAVNLTVTQ